MKKLSLANAEGTLSRSEMKNIMAGSGDAGGSCAVTINCSATKQVSCTSQTGHCTSSGQDDVNKWVQCDNDAKNSCN